MLKPLHDTILGSDRLLCMQEVNLGLEVPHELFVNVVGDKLCCIHSIGENNGFQEVLG